MALVGIYGRFYAVVQSANGAYDAEVLDSQGKVCLAMEGYRTAQYPNKLTHDLVEPLKSVFA